MQDAGEHIHQHDTHNTTPHTALHTLHTTHYTRHTTHSTQHTTHSTTHYKNKRIYFVIIEQEKWRIWMDVLDGHFAEKVSNVKFTAKEKEKKRKRTMV